MGHRRPPWDPLPRGTPSVFLHRVFSLSLMPFDPSFLSWLSELSPFLPSAGTRTVAAGLGQTSFTPWMNLAWVLYSVIFGVP